MSNYRQELEAKGNNVEDAIRKGLSKLGLSRDEVEIEVVDEGSRGLLGIGARDAVVVLRVPAPEPKPKPKAEPKPAPSVYDEPGDIPSEAIPDTAELRRRAEARREEQAPARSEPLSETTAPAAPAPEKPAAESTYDSPGEVPAAELPETAEVQRQAAGIEADEVATVACEVVEGLLEQMQVDAEVSLGQTEPDDLTGRRMTVVEVSGDDLGLLIGPRGETLDALQYIARLMTGHRLHQRTSFVVDVEGYRERREQALARLAERMAQKSLKQGRPITLEAMPAYERRIIHMTLRERNDVYTESTGEGNRRRVRIFPQ